MDHLQRARKVAPRISALLLGLVATLVAPGAMAAGNSCAPGSYSGNGFDSPDPCVEADPGYYVSEAEATSQTKAPVGTYTDTKGSVAAKQVPVGYYQPLPGQTSYLPAPAGTYVSSAGQSAFTPAPAGKFVAGAGQTAASDCPTGSYSYGSATACRRITNGPITDPDHAVVGPVLSGVANTQMVGNTITFEFENTTTDTASPSNLTDLTLIDFVLGGTSASLFNVVAPSDRVLSKGEHATLTLQWLGGASQPFSISLTVKTDQNACFAGDTVLAAMCPAGFSTRGAEQTVSFGGISNAAVSTVPEPSTWAIAALGLGLAAVRRRRPAGALPA